MSTIAISPIKGGNPITEIETTLRVGETERPADRMFRILDQAKGDERVVWDSSILDDIREAKRVFLELVKRGLKPFRVGINGQATSEVMSEFDPNAEEVIFLPQALVAGG